MPASSNHNQKGSQGALAVLESRVGYTAIGAAAGLAGVVVLLARNVIPASRAAVLVGAGPIFGAFAGFDFYATREWPGRAALLVRLELSCALAATLTGLCGVLVGAMALKEITQFTEWGFGIGLFVWLTVVMHAVRDEAVREGWRGAKKSKGVMLAGGNASSSLTNVEADEARVLRNGGALQQRDKDRS